jgi:voltage-gated potassium channel
VSVIRGHRVLGYDDPAVGSLQLTDRLITIVRAAPATEEPVHTVGPMRTSGGGTGG